MTSCHDRQNALRTGELGEGDVTEKNIGDDDYLIHPEDPAGGQDQLPH